MAINKVKLVRILMFIFLGYILAMLVVFTFADELILNKTAKTKAYVHTVSHFGLVLGKGMQTSIVLIYKVDGKTYIDTVHQNSGGAFPVEGDSIRIRYFIDNPSQCEIATVFPW